MQYTHLVIGIDHDAVEECMQPYGPNVDKVNALLSDEVREQTGLQLLRLPALYVDGVHARGRINSVTLMGMLCAGFGNHDPPSVCDCTGTAEADLMNCVKNGSFSASRGGGGMGFGAVLFIVLLVAGIVGSIGFVYWRRSQRQMREQVRSILAEYMPLEDQSMPGEMDSPRMHPAAMASAMSPRGFLPTGLDDDDDDGV